LLSPVKGIGLRSLVTGRRRAVASAEAPGTRRTHLVRREVGRFAMLSAFSLAVVVLLLGRQSRRIGMQEAIFDAKRTVYVVATSSIGPELTSETIGSLRSNDPQTKAAALKRLDMVAMQVHESAGIKRIKLWDSTGVLLYADDHRLLTDNLRLDTEELEALRLGRIEAEVSELAKPENRFDRGEGPLLEVYLPVQTEGGEVVLFESYLAYSNVIDGGRRILVQFAPSMLAGLVSLQGIGVLLVWSVARRLRRAQAQRELLLQHALEASDRERRRIAADLHDGVVQDLTGITLGLAATRMRSGASSGSAADVRGPESAGIGGQVDLEAQIRDSIHSLRSLIVDIYPPNLRTEGLSAALRSLCGRLHNRGIATTVQVDMDERSVPEDVIALAYRVIQESLRNVSAHAAATSVDITVEQDGPEFIARVEDDGIGFDPTRLKGSAASGHVGLRGLGDLVAERGGSLSVQSKPTLGTAVILRIPL
jgi:two-component system, NarL family, sensor kinase